MKGISLALDEKVAELLKEGEQVDEESCLKLLTALDDGTLRAPWSHDRLWDLLAVLGTA